jgi:K+-transporting ATPase ATPase A chain
MARVYAGDPTGLDRVVGPLERGIYRLGGVHPSNEMDWKTYGAAMLAFSAAGLLFFYLVERVQDVLPLNPQHLAALPPDLAFNNAISYVTNTNWQAYAGETTISYLTAMVSLTVQNFVSAATGVAILVALIRGLARRSGATLGNFWVDLVRTTLYLLLPIAMIGSLVLISEGAVQTFDSAKLITLLQPTHDLQPIMTPSGGPFLDRHGEPKMEAIALTTQTLAVGPAATQVVSRDLGTSGGGFFNANAAHPFESPTPLSDFFLLLLQTVPAAALTYTFGVMVGDTRQGWAILAAMLLVLAVTVVIAYHAESAGNPRLTSLGIDQISTDRQPGGNMEGKEVRFGIARTALVAAATTATSTGAANGMHDSLMPLGGLVTLFLMQSGEVILGGIGSGLAGMLVFVILGVFIGGLMIGRSPEYLGKRIDVYDMKLVALIILIMPAVVLMFTALAVSVQAGQASVFNPGPHGLSEVLYAYTSMTNNNGSTFGGLNANTLFYNVSGGVAMFVGRVGIALPTLALAGSFVHKRVTPAGPGTFPTHTPLFVVWLIGIVVLVGALTFLPALALGPIAEHVLMRQPS